MTQFAAPRPKPTYSNPAEVAAIGLCYTVRTAGEFTGAMVEQAKVRHGDRCFFCQYPPDVLLDYINEFRAWEPTFEGARVLAAWRQVSARGQRERVDAVLSRMVL